VIKRRTENKGFQSSSVPSKNSSAWLYFRETTGFGGSSLWKMPAIWPWEY